MRFLSRTLIVLAAAAASLLVSREASAQGYFCAVGFPVCSENEPRSISCYTPKDKNPVCGDPKCCGCNKSPGYVATGEYFTDAVDLVVPTNGLPLIASRRYSSVHTIDGPTGYGWSSSFHSRLNYTTYLLAAPSTYHKQAVVVMPDGDHFRFTQDPATGVFTAPQGRYDTLVQNVDGTFDLTIQRSRSKMHFSSDGWLLSRSDDYGNTLNYTYDGSARLQQVADASGTGRYLNVYWNPNGRISAVEDNSGRIVQYGYNTLGMLTSVTNAAGQTTTYTYVAGRFWRLLSQITDQWGRVITDITWDGRDRVVSYSENGETFTYAYALFGFNNLTSKRDSAGNTWVYPTGAGGLVTEERPPSGLGGATAYTTYNADGTLQLGIDPAGVQTYYTYASQGRVATVTRNYATGASVRFDYTYDPTFTEQVASILPKNPSNGANDPNWQGWKYDYYPTGSAAPGALHHVYRVRNDGVTTDLMATYTYDTKGRVTSVTDAAGSVTDYAYDTNGNLWTITAPSNNDAGTRPVTTYGYDPIGRVTSVTDPLGKISTYAYDALDRILTVTLPKPVAGSALDFTTTYTYDNWDAPSALTLTHVTDPNSILTKQGYDQFGRLRKSIDGLGNTTLYGYTKNLLTSITDANVNVTSYEYNGLKRLTATVFPDGARETYAYTLEGVLQSKTDRKSQTITFTYDNFKRLTRKTYPNSTYIEYTYTGQKLTQVYDNFASPAETHTFGYDTSFRVTSNVQATRGTIGYTYATNDAVATMSVTGGPTTTNAYYPDGSLNTINWSPVTGQFKYAYRLNGQYQTITMPNGQTRSYGYDDQGRLLQIANVHPTAGTLATYDYGYDLNHSTGTYNRLGQRVTMTANVPSQGFTGAATQYRYDLNYQLTQANYPAPAPFNGEVHAWTYDAIGNRLTNSVNAATTSYTYQKIGANPNNWQRLTSDGVNSYTYDSNGNTGTQGGSTYGWDYENRMTSISGSTSATYKYDYQGRRTSKTVSGTTTTYLYDGLNLINETGSNYLFGPGIDEPLAIDRSSVISYYAPDSLGSVALVIDNVGSVQNSYTYDTWGSARSTAEVVPQPFRYTARELGDLSNQWFYRARYYSTVPGRFLSEDPLADLLPRNIAFPQLVNTVYFYADNNPASLIDPLGLRATCGPAPVRGSFSNCASWTNAAKRFQLCELGRTVDGIKAASVFSAIAFGLVGTAKGGPKAGIAVGIGIFALGYAGGYAYETYSETLIEADYRRRKRDCELEACNNAPPRREYPPEV